MEARQKRKAPSRARVSRRNASRRWCVPPALLHEPDELLEGAGVLDELPSEVGLVLWQSLRDVTLWASVPPEARAALFTPQAARVRLSELLASGAEPALEVSLTTLAALVGSPGTANPEIVSLVCIQVSRWAEERGAFATAMGYAQAAAQVLPMDANPALAAGALALRWRRSARAETWLRRTVGLARRRRQWEAYAQAWVELGGLYTRRGQPALAQRFFVQGLRASRRHGLIAVRGAALHGLLMLAVDGGALDDAERYARGAMRAYGRGHPRLPELVHDVAYLWVRRESYARAIPMLQKLLPTRVEPVERALTLAILARAAAGAGNAPLYQESWMDAWTVINRRLEEAEKHARALLEMARASVVAHDWNHLEQAVRLASAAVSPQAERAVAAQVEELAGVLRARRARGTEVPGA
jgi:tetratricopeptide (TPR) repeat protein